MLLALETTTIFYAVSVAVSFSNGYLLLFGRDGSFVVERWICESWSLLTEQKLLGAKAQSHRECLLFQFGKLVDWILSSLVDLRGDSGTRGLGLDF